MLSLVPSAAVVVGASSCEVYEGPPIVTLRGAVDSQLTDVHVPLVLEFSKPVDPSSIRVTVARYSVDVEGNLPDEDDDPASELALFFEHSNSSDKTGTSTISADGRSMSITPNATFPVGARLVLIIEAGLSDREGNATRVRKRVVFSYVAELKCDKPVAAFEGKSFFFLVDVKKPIAAQVQLLTTVELDAQTGKFRAQFTNADRRDDQKCPTTCEATERCRLLPEAECVLPSERAGTVDEFPDFIPNNSPPTGFSFYTTGCVVDQDEGTAVFVTAPVDVEVQQPAVTLRNAVLTASFSRDDDGTLRGTGSLAADDVLLGDISSGRGEAGLSARTVPADQVPPNVPGPPPEQ